ncbi:MAG: LysR family transcriptional regulator [Deltaproteobacteria bacterium]|nr:LysR family transcriptional regulator [Deltaproteobacteria bacterium]
MDWTDLSHFLVLMRAGTLRAAAEELGVAPTTIGRRVTSLESSVGAPLFVRDARGLTPTELARELAAGGAEIEERMAALARRHQRAANDDVEGDVRVSATEIVTSEILAPSIGALLGRYPRLRVVLRVDPRVVSFSRAETELAVRMIRPEGKRLVAKKVATMEIALYATRGYLSRPGKLRPLREERLLSYDDTYGNIPELRWLASHGLSGALALRTSSTRALYQATLGGAGIGMLPTFLARRSPELVRVDPPSPLPPRAIYLVTHEDLRRVPRVRAVFDHIVEAFARIG